MHGMMTFRRQPAGPRQRPAQRPGLAGGASLQAGLFLPFWQNRPLVIEDRAGFLPWRTRLGRRNACVFLGLDENQPLFAIDIPGETEPAMEARRISGNAPGRAFVLPARDTAIAGQAKALIDWHRRHGFCPELRRADADLRRRLSPALPAMRRRAFPRTDPVVIMLPGLGRRMPGGAQGALSLAGFIPLLRALSSRAKP